MFLSRAQGQFPTVQYKAVPRKAATFLEPRKGEPRPNQVEPLSDMLVDVPITGSSSDDSGQAGDIIANAAHVTALRCSTGGVPGLAAIAIQQANLPENWICKKDQYPGVHNDKIQEPNQGYPAQPKIEGVPNYRKLPGYNIHGMGQPTIEGWREILTKVGANEKPVVWVNLREEPVIYVKGEPHCVREHEFPHHNVEAEGITREGVELAEQGLKDRFLDQMSVLKGHLWLNDEDPDGTINGAWWRANPSEIQTPLEVVEQLRKEGFKIQYHRVPVSDEHAPQTDDLSTLIDIFNDVPPETPRLINCHAGRGRTTTATSVAAMMEIRKAFEDVSPYFRDGENPLEPHPKDIAGAFSLLEPHRVLADAAIGKASQVQNIRRAVFNKGLAPTAPGAHTSADETSRMIRYTERYLKLIEVAQYLNERDQTPQDESYEEWVRDHSHATQAVSIATNTLKDWHIRTHAQ